MRRAVKANAKQHFIRLFHFFYSMHKKRCSAFSDLHLITASEQDVTPLFYFQQERSCHAVGGYIHKTRRGVFGPWLRLLGGQAIHSQSGPLGQTHSEAWGSDPGCGLPDASLRSAEGCTWSLDSVNNGRDTWLLRKSWWLRSNFNENKTGSRCRRNPCGRQFFHKNTKNALHCQF